MGILGLLRGMTFQVGADYKKDAQAFLAGLAAGTKNPELEEASYHLRTTANCYEQGLAEIDQVLEKKPASRGHAGPDFPQDRGPPQKGCRK